MSMRAVGFTEFGGPEVLSVTEREITVSLVLVSRDLHEADQLARLAEQAAKGAENPRPRTC
jgi:hypothetical protein